MILTFLPDNRKTYSLHDLGRLYSSWASFDTGEAGKTFVKRIGLHKRFDISGFNHIYELVGMKFHLIIGGAGARTFAAAHTFAHVNAADAKDFFSFIHVFSFLSQDMEISVNADHSFTPSASASSSVK
jgi:hypothetical protein